MKVEKKDNISTCLLRMSFIKGKQITSFLDNFYRNNEQGAACTTLYKLSPPTNVVKLSDFRA